VRDDAEWGIRHGALLCDDGGQRARLWHRPARHVKEMSGQRAAGSGIGTQLIAMSDTSDRMADV
jgi:hypothetical protein